MSDPYLIIAVAALAAFLIAVGAFLRGWRGWLDLKRAQLERTGGRPSPPGPAAPAARIELADLKERVRRLEAIAEGGNSPLLPQ